MIKLLCKRLIKENEALGAGTYPDPPDDIDQDDLVLVEDLESIKNDIDELIEVASMNGGYVYAESKAPSVKGSYIKIPEGYLDLNSPADYLLYDEEEW